MGAAEGFAIIEQEAPVGQIQRGHRYRQVLRERFAQTRIESGVPGQVRRHAGSARDQLPGASSWRSARSSVVVMAALCGVVVNRQSLVVFLTSDAIALRQAIDIHKGSYEVFAAVWHWHQLFNAVLEGRCLMLFQKILI